MALDKGNSEEVSMQKLTDLFGHSFHYQTLNGMLTFWKITGDPVYDGWCWQLKDKYKSIHLEFKTKDSLSRNYSEPKSAFTNNSEELYLVEVTFDNEYAKNKKPFPIALPFALKWGDDVATICAKIDKKPYEKSTVENYAATEYRYYFLVDDVRIMAALNAEKNLIWLRLFYIELSMRKSIELKKAMQQQNKNISILNIDQLELLKTSLPTLNWQQRMKNGDTIFNEKNIEDSADTLTTFIDTLVAGAREKKATKIYGAIKKAVTTFNKLNIKHGGYIDTMEREQLVGFIMNAVPLTGFKVEPGLDLTEECREW